jgi:predicted SPOUT superfamily RNA methylase MTH1
VATVVGFSGKQYLTAIRLSGLVTLASVSQNFFGFKSRLLRELCKFFMSFNRVARLYSTSRYGYSKVEYLKN